MTVALVTDSNSQLPVSLQSRYGVRVIPLTVTLDGRSYAEHTELTTAAFYDALAAGAEVTTGAPSPGSALAVYEAAAAMGATEIVSIHLGSEVSATFSSVSLAAAMSPVPVRLVDTGTASFAISLCVWEAAEALASGASAVEVADLAGTVASTVGNVFVMRALGLARRGGRLAAGVEAVRGVPVLALVDGKIGAVASASDADAAIDAMVAHVVSSADGASVRIGVGEAGMADVVDSFAVRLRATGVVHELVRYELGPSVGAHTGWGTLGACFAPVRR